MDHELAYWAQWHGRLMVVAWVLLLPLGVAIARYFKITPRQPWPQALDNKFWWHCHLTLQYSGITIMTVAAALAIRNADLAHSAAPLHGLIGFAVIGLGWAQVVGGWLRGSKGGPKGGPGGSATATIRGDHYDMTRRRVAFEYVHKIGGYLALALATVDIALGLRAAHAHAWIAALVVAAWLGGLAIAAGLQRHGRCVDTYQAIWGPGSEHPGNRRPPIGWGVRRPGPAGDEPAARAPSAAQQGRDP